MGMVSLYQMNLVQRTASASASGCEQNYQYIIQ